MRKTGIRGIKAGGWGPAWIFFSPRQGRKPSVGWPREPLSCTSLLAFSTLLSQGSAPHYPGRCSRGPAGEHQGREEGPVRSVPCLHTACARKSPLKPRWDSPVPPGCGGKGLRPQPQELNTTPPSVTDALGLLSRGRAGRAAVGRGRSGSADGDARRAPKGMGTGRAGLKHRKDSPEAGGGSEKESTDFVPGGTVPKRDRYTPSS